MEGKIKYKYLWAWDTMMGSFNPWKNQQQTLAAKENAPEDVIYRDSKGKWHRFADIESPQTKEHVLSIVKRIEENELTSRKPKAR